MKLLKKIWRFLHYHLGDPEKCPQCGTKISKSIPGGNIWRIKCPNCGSDPRPDYFIN